MSNSKRKCKQCGEYSPVDAGIKTPGGWFCELSHAIKFARAVNFKKAEKAKKQAVSAKKKEHAKQKREFYENDIKTRKRAAKTACHKFIRERDKNDGCICCGRSLGKNYDAGHFIESGNYPYLRYHEDNIHAQSVHCNQFKGGDSGDYERNLRAKIGDERVDYLLSNKNKSITREAQDYQAIEEFYKEKIKGIL